VQFSLLIVCYDAVNVDCN